MKQNIWQEKIQQRKEQCLHRKMLVLQAEEASQFRLEDKLLLSFSHNDYLGMARHPEVIKALQDGAAKYGVGSGAARLLGGNYDIHSELESYLTEFFAYPRALIFSTGYMANLAVLGTLIAKEDDVLVDRFCHASIIDAILSKQFKFTRYLHNDLASLTQKLTKLSAKQKWLITHGLFGMEGELADLPKISALAKSSLTTLIVDDAHGVGLLGEHGRGAIEKFSLSHRDVPILIGTFGKAFGTMGAFVLADECFIEALIQFSKPFIYTTAISPALACATFKSMQIVTKDKWRREYLNELVHYFQQKGSEIGLPFLSSQTAIQSLLVGDSKKLMQMDAYLKQRGILAAAVRYPSVPLGQARLKIKLNINHNKKDIDLLLQHLSEFFKL